MEKVTVNTELVKTTNGQDVYESMDSAVLELFSKGGSLTYSAQDTFADTQIRDMVIKAFEENDVLTIKTLFYLRDIRGGQGTRTLFRKALAVLAKHDSNLQNVLPLVPEYGRFDDLLVLLNEGNTTTRNTVIDVYKSQLEADLVALDKGESVSLLAKWLPSINTSNQQARAFGRDLAKAFGMSLAEYRKTLSKLRKHLDVVEVKLSAKEMDKVEYAKIPALALKKYRQAFESKDSARFTEYLNQLANGEVKAKTATLYPHNILEGIYHHTYSSYALNNLSENDVKLKIAQWNELAETFKEKLVDRKEALLPVIDLSGSMMTGYGSVSPLDVALALTILMSESNEGRYKNVFMNFSKDAKFSEIKGDNILAKLDYIFKNNYMGFDTNMEATFDLILNDAVEKNLPQSEIPSKLVYFSDMQINQMQVGLPRSFNGRESALDVIRKKFNDAGYEMPQIVFWNLNEDIYNNTNMAQAHSRNVAQLSGFSESTMVQVMNGDIKTPYQFMLDVLANPRYDKISEYYTLSFL